MQQFSAFEVRSARIPLFPPDGQTSTVNVYMLGLKGGRRSERQLDESAASLPLLPFFPLSASVVTRATSKDLWNGKTQGSDRDIPAIIDRPTRGHRRAPTLGPRPPAERTPGADT